MASHLVQNCDTTRASGCCLLGTTTLEEWSVEMAARGVENRAVEREARAAASDEDAAVRVRSYCNNSGFGGPCGMDWRGDYTGVTARCERTGAECRMSYLQVARALRAVARQARLF